MENLEWSPGMLQCNEKAPGMLLVRYYRYIAIHKVHIYIHLSYLAYILLESPKRLEREAKCPIQTCDNSKGLVVSIRVSHNVYSVHSISLCVSLNIPWL
jgi:hypothetical protein